MREPIAFEAVPHVVAICDGTVVSRGICTLVHGGVRGQGLQGYPRGRNSCRKIRALTPLAPYELIPTLGALVPRGGPVQDPVLTRPSLIGYQA